MKLTFNWQKPFDVDVAIRHIDGNGILGEGMTTNQLEEIKNYVITCEIAEYLLDNYEFDSSEDAMEKAIEVRDYMLDEYGDDIQDTENNAIWDIVEEKYEIERK